MKPPAMRTHPLYIVWRSMIGRCHGRGRSQSSYQKRGIQVCDRWRRSFWDFVADVGERPSGVLSDGRAAFSLDRYPDWDGDYAPGNVRWALPREQALNRVNTLGRPGSRSSKRGRPPPGSTTRSVRSTLSLSLSRGALDRLALLAQKTGRPWSHVVEGLLMAADCS